jgi:6-phosphofructo-2-kinase/fructose-2,6-biphosphatase
MSADFFRADNPEGVEARTEVAALAMEDMIAWMQEGGQVSIFRFRCKFLVSISCIVNSF